jgi:hypothetical protein
MNQRTRFFAGLSATVIAGGLTGCTAADQGSAENVAASITTVRIAEVSSEAAHSASVGRLFLSLLTEDQRTAALNDGIAVSDLNQAQQSAVAELVTALPGQETPYSGYRLRFLSEPNASEDWSIEIIAPEHQWTAVFRPDGDVAVSAAQSIN